MLNIVCCIFLKIKVKPGLTLQFTAYSDLEYTYTLSSANLGKTGNCHDMTVKLLTGVY